VNRTGNTPSLPQRLLIIASVLICLTMSWQVLPQSSDSQTSRFVSEAIFLQLIVVCTTLVYIFVFQLVRCSSQNSLGSMAPTLFPGDIALVDKLTFRLGKPIKHNDVIVFRAPKQIRSMKVSHRFFIKRVIGLPGDRIHITRRIGTFVNGELSKDSTYTLGRPKHHINTLGHLGGLVFDQSFRPYPDEPLASSQIIVPERHYFVLGDNRNVSVDSTVFGFISHKDIVGRVCWVTWRGGSRPHETVLHCSFCGLNNKEVLTLVNADKTNICDSCAVSLRDLLDDSNGKDPAPCSFCHQLRHEYVQKNAVICSDCLTTCDNVLQEQEQLDGFNRQIKCNLNDHAAYAGRAKVHTKQGHLDKSVEDLSKAISLNPQSADYYFSRAENYFAKSQYAQALEDCTNALALDKSSSDALMHRSLCYIKVENYQAAADDCKALLAINLDNAVAHNNLGRSLLGLEHPAEALKEFELAISLDPAGYPRFFFNRGWANFQLQHHDEAISDLTVAIEKDPATRKQSYKMRSEAYRQVDKPDLAEADEHTLSTLTQSA
jgi:signal peptidase I